MKKNARLSMLISIIIGWVCSLIIFIPFAVVVVNSFKTVRDSMSMSLTWPDDGWIISNYIEVISGGIIVRSFFNSLLISSMCTIFCIILAAMAAFVIQRRKSKLHSIIFYLFFAGLIAPVNYITILQTLRIFRINGTFTGLIIVFIAMGIPFASFLLYNFMSRLPTDIDESGIIDGAGILNLFFRIIFPLLKPITITAATLTFISSWNDFISPLYLLNSTRKLGMILMVYNYWGFMHQEWGKISAVIILTLIPVLIMYISMQKYIIAGMTQGAVKG